LPVMVKVNAPTFTELGVTLESCGTGFSSVTPLLAFTDDFDASVASMVIVFGDGSVTGAV
ncbi:MAG: hypothetical protein WBY38_06815, partial [Candidatus Acidiferrales bacterium]